MFSDVLNPYTGFLAMDPEACLARTCLVGQRLVPYGEVQATDDQNKSAPHFLICFTAGTWLGRFAGRSAWPLVGRPKTWRRRDVHGPQVTKLLRLFGCQNAPYGQHHLHMGLFEIDSRLIHFVHLGEHLGFVRQVFLHLGPQDGILFFQVGAQVDVLDLVILGDFLDFLDLLFADMEFLREFRIPPPFSFRARNHAWRALRGRIHH